MADENPGNQTLMRRLIALVSHSAEYSIAFALLVVCLIVGAAVWLLQPGTPSPSAQNTPPPRTAPAHSAESAGADEQAAMGAWKQKLEGGFDQADQQQRHVEDQREKQERKQQAEDPPPKPQYKPQPVAVAKPVAAEPAPVAAPVIAPPVAVAPKPQPVYVNAAIDWTSCKRPAYPDISMRKNEEGVVVIDIDLDANARILGSRVSQSSGHERLDTTTQRAIEKCSFRSATSDGRPQASTASVRFTWKLQSK